MQSSFLLYFDMFMVNLHPHPHLKNNYALPSLKSP